MAGRMMAASMPMIASTHRISISAKPRSAMRSARAAGNVGCSSTAAFLTVRPKRDDFVGSVLARRTIDVAVPPGIVGHDAAPQIRPVPAGRVVAARQRGEAFIGVGITPKIEIIEIERAGKAFDLDFRGLGFGLAEIAEYPRSDQRHDQPDDRDHHENFDQREAGLPATRPAGGGRRIQNISDHLSRLLEINPFALNLTLQSDLTALNQTPALSFCLSMIFSENRVPLLQIML